jgi:hypothetical protein
MRSSDNCFLDTGKELFIFLKNHENVPEGYGGRSRVDSKGILEIFLKLRNVRKKDYCVQFL